MKKLFGWMLVALFATTSLIAQTGKKPGGKTAGKSMTHCYAMKDGTLLHCMGTKGAPQKETVTLKNGTTISPSGEVTMKDGTTKTLENGQCISPGGKMMAFEKMHPKSKAKM